MTELLKTSLNRRTVLQAAAVGAAGVSPLMMRLDPSIPLECPKGAGRAILVQDMGEEHDMLWTIIIDRGPNTGQIWTYRNRDVRSRENVTMGRPAGTKPFPDSVSW